MHSGHARCLIRRSSASVWFLVTSSTLFAQGTTPSTLTPASTPAHQIFDLSVFVIAVSQVRAICEAAMREYGVPARIRTDNGAPFAGTGLLGLSKLSLGWMKLGIVHERIQAGRPQQNGRHERMHRTLKEDTTKPPAASLRAQQSRFDNFRYVFNNERPHEGLNNRVPASFWRSRYMAMPGWATTPRVGTAVGRSQSINTSCASA